MGNDSGLKTTFERQQGINATGYTSRMEAAEDLLHKLLANRPSDFKQSLGPVAKEWPGITNDVVTTLFTIGEGIPGARTGETTILLMATLLGNPDFVEAILEDDPLADPHTKVSLKESPLSWITPIDLAEKIGLHTIVEKMNTARPLNKSAHAAANDSIWGSVWNALLHRNHG